MTNYRERPTSIGGSTSNGTSLGNGSVRLCLTLKDNSEGLILKLQNIYYLPSSSCNLVSLVLLNNNGIFHDNEHEILYQVQTKQILAEAKHWKNSYLLRPLNLSDAAVQLLRVDDKTYKWLTQAFCTTSPDNLPLTTWHKQLGHIDFRSLKSLLQRLEVEYVNKSEGHICDSCQRAKATKMYN